mmetsp:Transcript_92582/g.167263  ORF Transcript_92582/g.167263 Transcript_92582/m.167263 type:complete len:201 (-) Transcript_92582:159-761(-)
MRVQGCEPVLLVLHGHRPRPWLVRPGCRLGHLPHGLKHHGCRHQGPPHQLQEPREHHFLRSSGHLRCHHRNHHGQQDRRLRNLRSSDEPQGLAGTDYGGRLVHVLRGPFCRAVQPLLRHLRGRFRQRLRAGRCSEARALREDADRGDLWKCLGPVRRHCRNYPGQRCHLPEACLRRRPGKEVSTLLLRGLVLESVRHLSD